MEALRLYRALLRMAKQYDIPHIRTRMMWVYSEGFFCGVKTIHLLRSYNIRDMFEIFRDEKNPGRVQSLISRGWKIRDVLEKLSAVEEMKVIMNKQK